MLDTYQDCWNQCQKMISKPRSMLTRSCKKIYVIQALIAETKIESVAILTKLPRSIMNILKAFCVHAFVLVRCFFMS